MIHSSDLQNLKFLRRCSICSLQLEILFTTSHSFTVLISIFFFLHFFLFFCPWYIWLFNKSRYHKSRYLCCCSGDGSSLPQRKRKEKGVFVTSFFRAFPGIRMLEFGILNRKDGLDFLFLSYVVKGILPP